MRLSEGKIESSKPKVVVFKCCAITSKLASKKTMKKVETWFDEYGKNIKIYEMHATTKKSWFGRWVSARFYVFYKDIPQ